MSVLWQCTICMRKNPKKEFLPVMYRGTDWRNCPSCNAPAIPLVGEGAVQEPKLFVNMLKDIKLTLRHARIFITSKEKMHEAGVDLYDDILIKITKFIERN